MTSLAIRDSISTLKLTALREPSLSSAPNSNYNGNLKAIPIVPRLRPDRVVATGKATLYVSQVICVKDLKLCGGETEIETATKLFKVRKHVRT